MVTGCKMEFKLKISQCGSNLMLLILIQLVVTSYGKPNVLFILVDDMGFNDVSYHGSTQTKTPNIDDLGTKGTVFTRHYTQPVCSPSRGALLTSKYAIHIGMQDGVIVGTVPAGLPLEERLMPAFFGDMGYFTHAIGKWHVGYYKNEYLPTKRGFDTFFGFYESGVDYYTHSRFTDHFFGLDLHWDTAASNTSQPIWGLFGNYTTDMLTQHAKNLIELRDETNPFFIYLSHRAVHHPTQCDTELINRFGGVWNATRRNYLAQVASVDDSVGELVQLLEGEGILDDTIVVVASDNGGQICQDCGQSNYPLRGGKNTNFEGGVRTPALIVGPGVQSGKTYSDYFHITDWLPTLMDAVGGDTRDLPDDVDGISQWDAISSDDRRGSEKGPRDEILVNIHNMYGEAAIIKGDYKLHYVLGGLHEGAASDWYYSTGPLNHTDRDRIYEMDGWILPVVNCSEPDDATACVFNPKEESVCLFNIKEDPCEYNNIADSEVEIVDELMERLAYFNSTMVPSILKPSDNQSNPALRDNVWGPWE
ncbi:arylsulfatase J-like [Convolutriloba macropyga]|uniref:arylsulfatase J-like n=1 Tax=Convolutriloba macropyga TaxID=536237 RepID=UPI003F5222F1